MPDLTRGITACNILAYTRRYVSLLHIGKVLVLKFDSDFISTTLEEQPEWDCKVPVSSKQEDGLDIYCAVFGHSSGESGTVHENRERTAGKGTEGTTTHFPNTVHSITGRLFRGARLHIHGFIMYYEQLHSNILHIYPVLELMSSIRWDFSEKTKI